MGVSNLIQCIYYFTLKIVFCKCYLSLLLLTIPYLLFHLLILFRVLCGWRVVDFIGKEGFLFEVEIHCDYQQSIYNTNRMSQSSQSQNHSIKLQQNMEGEQNEKPEQISQLADKEGSTRKRIHRKSQISNFIMKTYKILQDKKNSHIIEWTDGGNCFIVKNKDLFQNEILPKYFKHRKFSSFVRQLNMYDFHKIRKEKEIPIFKHKYFKMNFYDLLHKIKRKSGEQTKQEDMDNAGPSLGEIGIHSEGNIPFSFKSKTSMNATEEIDALIYENNELRNSIADISKQIMQFEINKDKKKEKLVKMMSALVFFDLAPAETNEQYSLRDLQNHFINQEEPLSLREYTSKLANLFRCIKASLIE